jgi:hypothetical protein
VPEKGTWGKKATCMPQTPPSRARPEALIPPKGDPAASEFPFISTMPDRSKRAKRFRRGPSDVCTCSEGANEFNKRSRMRLQIHERRT